MRRRNRSGRGAEATAATMTCAIAAASIAGLLVSFGAAADAQSPRDLAEQAFSETDANRDGQVNREEYYRRMADMYYHADVDRDGQLSRAELVAVQEPMVFDPADVDADGVLTMPEYIDERFDTFHDLDDDSDGRLKLDEVIEHYEESFAE